MKRRLPRRRGQAMMETILLVTLIFGTGASLMYWFPDSFNALQIYMDSFYFVLSMPVP
jgi:hypothetical protein